MMDALQGKVEALDSEVRQIGDSLRNYLHFGTTGVRTVKPPGTKAGRDLLQHLLARIEQVSAELTNVSKISSDVSPPGPDTPQSYGSPIAHQQSPVPHHQQETPPVLPAEARPPPSPPSPPSPERPSAPTPQAALLTNTGPAPPLLLDPRSNPPAQAQASRQSCPAPQTLPISGQPLLCDHASPLFACTYRDVNILNEERFEGYSAHPIVQDRGYFKLQVGDLPPLVVEKMDRPTRDHATSFRYKMDAQGNVKVDSGKRVKFSNPRLPFPHSAKKEWTFEEQRALWNGAALNPPKGSMSYIIGNPLFQDVELAPGEKLKRRGRTILEGINTQYVYFNLTGKTITTMHREDAHVRSENLLRSGEHKFWCFVKPKSTARFEEQMKLVYPQMRGCSQAVRHLSLHIPPFQLEKWGVEYTLDYCVPGQAVVTEPGTYHQVLNLGKNYAIAINVEYMSSPDDPVDYTFCDDACPDKFAMTADDFKFHSKEEGEEEEEEEKGEDTSSMVQELPGSTQALAPPLNGRAPELPELSRVQSQQPPAPPPGQPSAESLAPPPIGEPQTAVLAPPPSEMDLAPRPTTEGTSSPTRTTTAEPMQTLEHRNLQPRAHGSHDERLGANVLLELGVSSPAGGLPMNQPLSSRPILESPRLSMEQAPTPPIYPDAETPTSLLPDAIAKRATVLSRDVISDLAMPRDLPGPMLQPPLPRAAAKHTNPFSRPRGGNGLSLPLGPLRHLRAPYASEKPMPYSPPTVASMPPQTLAPSPPSISGPTIEKPPLHPPPHVMASPIPERPISERPPSPSMRNEVLGVPAPVPSQPTSGPAYDTTAEPPKGKKRSATSAPAQKAPKKSRISRKKALPLVPVSDAAPISVPTSEVALVPLVLPASPKRIAFRSLAALCAPKAAFERLNELGNPTVFTLIARVELQQDSGDAIHIFLRRFVKMILADLATKYSQGQDEQPPDLEKAMGFLLERLGWNEKDREKLYDFIREGRCWKALCGFDDGLLCIMPLDDEFVNLAVYQQDVQGLLAQFQSPVYRTLSSALPGFAWEGMDPVLQPHVEINQNIFVLDGHEWPTPAGWKVTWPWPSDPTIIRAGGHCQLCKKRAGCICLAKLDGRANIYFTPDGTIRSRALFRRGRPLGELVGEMVPFCRPDLENQAVAEIYPGRHGNWVRKFKVLRVAGRWRVVLITAKYGRGFEWRALFFSW
ncbi:hypothetical protein B0T18DRAFT_397005 [Schizothecium vesticola]|uniref:JmjC domain-containing protein n=1 Tax=Schizothecium vesticola TaxID=314040 RepID=A0AA40F9G5_9PEZI|nr:hypothetical protein B0T18DRAFT_397005 [Schizothecium vesticola]